MMKKLLFLLLCTAITGGCTFSQFAAKVKGLGLIFILLSILLVVIYRRSHPERRFRIRFRKKNLDL